MVSHPLLQHSLSFTFRYIKFCSVCTATILATITCASALSLSWCLLTFICKNGTAPISVRTCVRRIKPCVYTDFPTHSLSQSVIYSFAAVGFRTRTNNFTPYNAAGICVFPIPYFPCRVHDIEPLMIHQERHTKIVPARQHETLQRKY